MMNQKLSMMTRVHLVTLIFCCVSSSVLSEPAKWLIQGDLFTEEEARSRLIQLDTHKSYFPVSTRAEMYYVALPGKFINCVIAASVFQNGEVSVVEGGYGTKTVRVRYVTENGKSDTFFILVQTAKREPVSIEGNVVSSKRLSIVYEPVRNWTLEEIQDVMRKFPQPFPLRND